MILMVHNEEFQNEKALVAENSLYRIVCLPEFGGKLVSFYDKAIQKEFLFQNPKPRFCHASLGSDFSEFEACGLDDAFPSIDACSVLIGDHCIEYPDHGEIWSSCFKSFHDDKAIHLVCNSKFLPYRYEKTYVLDNDGLTIDYLIANTGKEAFPCIWTFHCLLMIEEDMHLVFPSDTRQILNVLNNERLGPAGSVLPFPLYRSPDGQMIDLGNICSPKKNSMEKFYINQRLSEGVCGMYYKQSNTLFKLVYDIEKLPYLGFWKTLGGYRGDYNCALEPSNGFYDSIDTAMQYNACPKLSAQETLSFSLRLTTEHLEEEEYDA